MIQLELESGDNRVCFHSNGYLLIFNQEELLEPYEDSEHYGTILSIVNTWDTLDVTETTAKINDLFEYSWAMDHLDKYMYDCMHWGQAIVITPKMRRLTNIELVQRKQPPFYDRFVWFENPATGDTIFRHVRYSLGCPSF